MKYKIKEGMATIPISEVNRLNADAEELEVREKELTRKENEFNKMIAEKKVVTITHHFRAYSANTVDVEYNNKDELIEKLVAMQFSKELDELETLRKRRKIINDEIIGMSKKELIKYQEKLEFSRGILDENKEKN